MQDDMYREYVDRIERIHDDRLMYEKNIRQLDDFSTDMQSIDSVMSVLMEELMLTNRDDHSFMKELYSISEDLQEARVAVDNNITYKYEDIMCELQQLDELEQQVEYDYRTFVNENYDEE